VARLLVGALVFSAALSLLPVRSAAQDNDAAASLSPAEREVFRAELAREAATNASDFAAVERLTDDDFIQVTKNGITDRATRIATAVAPPPVHPARRLMRSIVTFASKSTATPRS
jgi:hypothetical protein